MGSVEFSVEPLPKPFEGSSIDFGCKVSGIDLENMSGKPFT
jgi:hypothetical protein